MAIITGLTAERMEEIEDSIVTDGYVSGDDLILQRHDGSTVNAGNVRGAAATKPSVVTSLPGSPTNLDEIYFQTAAMATIGRMWHCKYTSALGKWVVLSGAPLFIRENTGESGLAAAGTPISFTPAVTIALPIVGRYLIRYGAWLTHSGTNQGASVVPVATGLAYDGNNRISHNEPGSNNNSANNIAGVIEASDISGTLELKYQANVSGGSAMYKWMEATPILIG